MFLNSDANGGTYQSSKRSCLARHCQADIPTWQKKNLGAGEREEGDPALESKSQGKLILSS